MNLENFEIINSSICLEDNVIGISFDCFNKILERIRVVFKELHISVNDKTIYYERFADKTSILAIKLSNGDDFDSTLYMFNGCDASSFEKYSSCDVYLHADKKVAQSALKIANLMSRDIVKFFEEIEEELLLNNQKDSSFSLRMPIYQKDKQNDGVAKKLAKIFNGFGKKEK